MAKLLDLPLGRINATERDRLLEEISPLLKYLGAPGDWGYGTKLGELTFFLHQVHAEVQQTEISAQGDVADDAIFKAASDFGSGVTDHICYGDNCSVCASKASGIPTHIEKGKSDAAE